MQFKQYTSYKNSGVEWLGDIPKQWESNRLKKYLIERNEKNTPVKTDNLLSVTMYQGVIPVSEKLGNGGNKPKENLENYKISYPNDIVLNSMNVIVGSVGLNKYMGLISPAYYALYNRNKNNNIKFFSYIFHNPFFQKGLFGLGNGIMYKESEDGKLNTIRLKIPMEKLNQVVLPCPSISEQNQIVSFLDTETARIDNLIAKQEKLIELLEEQRKSIISHAVTKGLNPNAPMKDSGVEWLGEVPEHWIISRVKFNFRNLDSKRIPLTSEERSYRQGVYPYYGASGIIDYVNSFIFEEDLVLFSEDGANLAYRSMPIAFVAKGKYWVNNHAHILKPFDNLTAYWACVLESVDVNLSITGATQPKITAENLGNICISFPPSFEERLSINNYILEESLKIDTLILKQNQLIEKLKEYRSSIISHAVTGKIDVREFGA